MTWSEWVTPTLLGNWEVPRRGLEPLCLAAPDPKSGASANFATSAQFSEFERQECHLA